MVDAIQTDEKGCFDGRYLLIRPLSTDGATADVWLSLDLNTVSSDDIDKLDKIVHLSDDEIEQFGLMVAIKIYRPQNALDIEGEQRFRDEYMIVFNCHHANLIHPTNFSIYKDTPYLVLPYCKRGSSELLIGTFVDDGEVWRYIRDVAAGLNYLHHNNPPIIHQDIKPANVLIDENDNYAITDFGISAKRFKRSNNDLDNDGYEEQSGTYAYMAPERFKDGNLPSAESDIWAFGATLYELLTGQVPFGEDGGLVQPDGKVSLSFNDTTISDDIKHLICACLSKNPSERPTAEQIMDTANQKKSKTKTKLTSIGKILPIFCVLILVGVTVWYQSHKPAPPIPMEKVPTVKEQFNEAMVWLDAGSTDSVKMGVKKLKALVDSDYVPAMYELAVTFGGMTDELHIKRKKLLGIELGNNTIKDDDPIAKRTPKSDEYNNAAIHYYTRIVHLSKLEFSELNMQSQYRLGFYYFYLKKDKQTALSYFKKAKETAVNLNDGNMKDDADFFINLCQLK